MNEQYKETTQTLAILAICIGVFNLLNTILSNYFFIHSVVSEGAKAVVDATNYREIYYKIIINAVPFLIIWLSYILSGLAILKLKNYGRIWLVSISIFGLLVFFVIPILQFLPHLKNAVLSFDSITGLFVINILAFTKKAIKELFKKN